MKASSYFTDGEIELAMGILADLLSNQDFLNEISISHDATDKYYKLIDKIDVYFNDLDFRNETPQE
jgi:hypothetical protein